MLSVVTMMARREVCTEERRTEMEMDELDLRETERCEFTTTPDLKDLAHPSNE